ncbi:MucBP domain-containing protein [Isobaculum melis]|uniref:MucBP domain-containing protein n=1 Tax=Isobaculum melis TaxID=142588 RepID=A0A1H9U834_9LACT|nr:MucBP domain-containing protein [Isobaculum melis]SES05626.1 MucBP domain-containing protein [Isobaculum melis]
MLKKKWFNIIILTGCLFLFAGFMQHSSAETIKEPEVKIGEEKAIDFIVKRSPSTFTLENLTVKKDLGTIKTVNIEMPEGVGLNFFPPAGWVTYSRPNSTYFNFLLTANNSPEDVERILSGLTFSDKKTKTIKGKISITVETEAISAWNAHPDGKMHYYKFVPTGSQPLTFLEAYNAAKKERYNGLTGYLATITSAAEHDFIFDSIAKAPGWLGGTRMVNNDRTRINDEASIPTAIHNYDITAGSWYWVSGPEAGKVFFEGKTFATGFVPIGGYASWNNSPKQQPDNNGGVEYTLEFASFDSKLWNDLSYDHLSTMHNQGYYVEFSEYGNQKEVNSDACEADIPQYITVKYLDQANNEVLAPSVYAGTTFSFGEVYNTANLQKEIKGYDLVAVPANAQGKYGGEPITVTYYYVKQQLTFHIQQVILNHNAQLVIPSKGYAEIDNLAMMNPLDPESPNISYEKMNVTTQSLTTNADDYTTVTLVRNPSGQYYRITGMIPEYYESVGYVLTDIATPHSVENAKSGKPIIDTHLEKKEYWVTFYLKPITELPKPHSWGYNTNSFNNFQ